MIQGTNIRWEISEKHLVIESREGTILCCLMFLQLILY